MTRTVLALLLLASCVDGSPPIAPTPDTLGGSIFLPQCGYELTTRPGASAPVIGSALLGADPTPRQIHLGLAADPARTVVVQWRTVDETTLATTVQYGAGEALDRTQDGVTFIYVSGFNGNGETVRMHETHLCGLQPDTEYSYRVGGAGSAAEESWSATFSFRTAPDPALDPDGEVVLGFLGDSRDGYDIWALLVQQLIAQGVDLVLFSGDAVTLGAVQVEWDTYFEAAEPLFTRVPVISAHGNHDINAINYYAQLAMPGNEEWYSLDYGAAHITVLNDTPLEAGTIRAEQAQFLDADLAAAAAAPWKLVMHHRPIYSASSKHGSDTELLEVWAPIFDQHEVDLVLSGHDHDYERSKPMRGNAVQSSPADGTVYLVTGGAGASLYGNGVDFWTEYSEKTYSAAVLRVRAGQLDMQAFRHDGSPVDSLVISKP